MTHLLIARGERLPVGRWFMSAHAGDPPAEVEVVEAITKKTRISCGRTVSPLPPMFDPIDGAASGVITQEDSDDGYTIVEYFDGIPYGFELLAIARTEHPRVTWRPLPFDSLEDRGTKALYGCARGVLVAMLMQRRLPEDT